MTSERHLGHQAEEHPDRPAIVMAGSGLVTTYQDLNERSNRLAHLLRDAGLRTGDHIALMMENGPEFLEVAFGKIGEHVEVDPVLSKLFLVSTEAETAEPYADVHDRASPWVKPPLILW